MPDADLPYRRHRANPTGLKPSDYDEELDDVYRWLKRLQDLLNDPAATNTTFPPTPHDILSTEHSDTTPAAAVTGDLIRGNAAVWERLGIGASGDVLAVAAGLPAWSSSPPASMAHNVLDTVHTDSVAASAVLGDVIVAQSIDTEGVEDVFFDGAPVPGLILEDTGGGAYWLDGAVMEFLFETPEAQWARKAIGTAGQVLVSDGSEPQWADVASLEGGTAVGARVYSAASFAIADATLTTVSFDTVDVDDDDYFTLAAASRLTVPTARAGWYSILCGAIWPSAITGFATWVVIKINGTEIARNWVGGGVNVNIGSTAPGQCALLKKLAAGDYVEMAVEVQNYGALTITGGQGTFLSMVKL